MIQLTHPARVNDYFITTTSGTVESLLSATRRYPLLSNDSLLSAHHYWSQCWAIVDVNEL